MHLIRTHYEGTVVNIFYEEEHIARLTMTKIRIIEKRNKYAEFVFKNFLDDKPPERCSIKGEDSIKPMKDSRFPMNKLEISINQKRRLRRGRVSFHYVFEEGLKIYQKAGT